MLSNCCTSSKKAIINDKIDYKNELILKNKIGSLHILSKDDNRVYSLIKWQNGFYSIGVLIDNKENGHWYLFSKSGVIRKDIFFSNGEANQVKEYDRKGKLILKTNFTTNF